MAPPSSGEHRGGLLGGAVEVAVGVAAVLGALGIGGVAGQPARRGRRGVEVRLVAGVVDDHQRRFGGQAVEPRERRLGKAVLQQRVPAVEVRAVGAAVGDLAPDRGDDVVGVAHRDRPDVDHAVGQHDRLHQRMPVRLDEAGHHAAVAEFDDLGSGADPALDLGPIADRDDAAVGHRQRLGGGLEVIDGEDGPGNDQVSGGIRPC